MDRISLLLLAIVFVADAAPKRTGPGIDAIIDRVDQFRWSPATNATTNNSVFQRIEDVKNDKADVTGFFEMLGDVFTNGIVGHFEDENAGNNSFRKLYVNTNRTSGALSEKLVRLFKEFWIYDSNDETWHNQMFPYNAENELALEAIRLALRGMQSRSKAFYDELVGTTAEQVGLELPFRDNELDGKRCYASRLDEICSWWGWTHNASMFSYTMLSLLRIMGPGCESKITDDRYLRALQLNIYDIAQMRNFSGGESNRCFHKFFIRYHGYNEREYKTFVLNLASYLAYERGIYGFCSRIQQVRDNVPPPSEPTITGQLATIRQRLLDALCILTEEESPCSHEETATIDKRLLSSGEPNSASGSNYTIPREAREKCILPPVPTTTGPETIITSTTDSSQKTRMWIDKASNAAKQAIGNKRFKYPSQDSALETYRATGMLMIALLKQSNESRDLYDYKALVFYAANDDSEYCIRNGTGGDLYSHVHNNVRFLVARYNRTQLANETWESRITPKIHQTFSENDMENQCDRLKKVDEKLNGALSEFGAVAAIKCARKFVWYELGYSYFQAAWTNSVDIPMTHGSKYSSKCGKIVLFP